MPKYFLQDDGETIMDDAGTLVGRKSELEAKGMMVRPPQPVELTEADIPEPTQPGFVDSISNAFRGAVQSVPELSPYQSAPGRPPALDFEPAPPVPMARTRAEQFGRSAMGESGGLGSQDIYTRAMNRVTGDLMAYDNIFEKDNELNPKRVVNALVNSADRMTPQGMKQGYESVLEGDGMTGALTRGLARGSAAAGEFVGGALQYTGTAAQYMSPYGQMLPPVVKYAGEGIGDYYRKQREIAANAAPAGLKGDVFDKPGLMADPRWWTENTTDAAISMVPALLTGAVGGTALGAAVGGAQEAFAAFRGMLEDGKMDEGEALIRSGAYGVVSSVLNKIGLDRMLKPEAYKGMLRKALGIFATGGVEAFTEWAEGPAQKFLEKVGRVPMGELADEVATAAKQELNVVPPSFILGGGVHAVSSSMSKPKPSDSDARAMSAALTNQPAIRFASPADVQANQDLFFDGKRARTVQEVHDLIEARAQPAQETEAGQDDQGNQASTVPTDQQTDAAVPPARPWDTTIPGEEETDPAIQQDVQATLDLIGGDPTLVQEAGENETAPAQAAPTALTEQDQSRADSLTQRINELTVALETESNPASIPWIEEEIARRKDELQALVGAAPAQAAQEAAPGALAPDVTEGMAEVAPAPQMPAGEVVPTPEGISPQVTPQVQQDQTAPQQEVQQPTQAPYISVISEGIDSTGNQGKPVQVEGVDQATGKRGTATMSVADAIDTVASNIEDYRRLLDCL